MPSLQEEFDILRKNVSFFLKNNDPEPAINEIGNFVEGLSQYGWHNDQVYRLERQIILIAQRLKMAVITLDDARIIGDTEMTRTLQTEILKISKSILLVINIIQDQIKKFLRLPNEEVLQATIKENYDEGKKSQRGQKFVYYISNTAGIPLDQINLISYHPGSIIIIFSIPSDKITQLFSLYFLNLLESENLQDLSILDKEFTIDDFRNYFSYVGYNLSQTNLTGFYLRETDLVGASLIRANLIEANLQGANLVRANLREAHLRGANLQGANLQDAYLRNANLIGVNLQEADLRRANLIGIYLIEANLQGANLVRANLREAYLRGANLQGAHLISVDLQEAHLRGVNLKDADLSDAELEGTELKGADLRGANLQGANLIRADLKGALALLSQKDILANSGADISQVKFVDEPNIRIGIKVTE